MPNVPVFLTRAELIEVLDDIRRRVEAGDSWEGHLEYLLPWSEEMGDPETDEGDGFRVRAGWRVGNLMGQGGMRIIGKME